MDEPSREELENEFLELQQAVVDARSACRRAEYELAHRTKEYPEIAARIPPIRDLQTLAETRSDELTSTLKRINRALGSGLTGEEPDYWLQLAAYAREKCGLTDDDFQDMTMERLAAFIDDRVEGPKGIPVSERMPLLEEYARSGAMPGRYSDRRLYRSENFPAGEKEFKNWKSGKLSRTSQTSINIENFLRRKTIPKEVTPSTR
jgi:hypothetical protein